jgi:hypothetical protein
MPNASKIPDILALAGIVLLSACASPPLENSQQAVTPQGQLTFDATLWRAARESVDFLPIRTADPLDGTLETGWGQALGGSPYERFRIAVRLDYRAAYAQAATVTIDKQTLVEGQWTEAATPIAATYAMANAIAARAGELRLAANPSKSGS